ncbi:MAG: BatD family protein [Candidatus Omnitrophica bacterium]|jgi:hypothetical protein|nr:BatD family protein [Candidatus Omnitrophota bacterium]
MHLRISLFRFIILIFLSTAAYAQTPSIIEASVNKHKITTGEIFTYTLKIEGEFLSPKLTIPKFDNFTIASQGQQRQYTSKGNRTTLTIKITYHLFAPNPGSFTIEGANVADKNKRIEAKPIAIEVTGKPLKEKIKVAPHIERGIDI